jgi:hypothetical protein
MVFPALVSGAILSFTGNIPVCPGDCCLLSVITGMLFFWQPTKTARQKKKDKTFFFIGNYDVKKEGWFTC